MPVLTSGMGLIDTDLIPAQILTTELALILHNASIFAGKDDTIPMIAAVRLESTGTHLVATGTDRYTLGAQAAPYKDEKWVTILPIEHVQTLLTVLGKVYGDWTTARLSLSPKKERFKVEIPTDDIKFSFPTRHKDNPNIEFPAWRSLVKGEKVTPESPSVFSLNPKQIARFAKLKYRRYTDQVDKYMRVSVPTANKAIQIRIGDSFIGLVMPTRDLYERKELTWL